MLLDVNEHFCQCCGVFSSSFVPLSPTYPLLLFLFWGKLPVGGNRGLVEAVGSDGWEIWTDLYPIREGVRAEVFTGI